MNDGVWKSDDFEATLYFYDPHGLITCYYRIDKLVNGAWQNVGGTETSCSSSGSDYYWDVTIHVGDLVTDKCTVEGQNTCRIRVWNTRMDWKAERLVSIDYKNPTTTISPSQDYYVWSVDDITFTLNCEDIGSGCRENHYYITNQDGNTLVPHTVGNSYTISCSYGSDCRRTVYYHSKDNIGKENSETSRQYKIDKKAPTPNPAVIATIDFSSSSISITAQTASDSGAGGITYIYNVDGRTEESNYHQRSIYNLQSNTYYCINVWYRDSLGNTGGSDTECGYTDVRIPSFSLNRYTNSMYTVSGKARNMAMNETDYGQPINITTLANPVNNLVIMSENAITNLISRPNIS